MYCNEHIQLTVQLNGNVDGNIHCHHVLRKNIDLTFRERGPKL